MRREMKRVGFGMVVMIGAISGIHEGGGFQVGLLNYSRLFLALVAAPLFVPKNEYPFIFRYTIFSISIFQIVLFLIGWLPKLLFTSINFSGFKNQVGGFSVLKTCNGSSS